MPFVLLDDKFHGHGKTVEVGNAGAGLYVRALSRCADYLTDGHVPKGWACEVAPVALRKKLTAAGFWIEVSGGESYHYLSGDEFYTVAISGPGYFIPDYLEFNPTREAVLSKREELSQKRSEAGKKGAQVRWQRQRQTDGKGDGKAIATPRQTDSPLSPSPKDFSKAVAVRGETASDLTSIKDLVDRSLKEAS